MNDPEVPGELPNWLEAAQTAGLDTFEIAAMASHAHDRSLAEAFEEELRVIFGGEEADTREEER